MSSDTFNWLAMAALSALLIIFGTSTLVDVVTGGHSDHHGPEGYKLPVEVASADQSGGGEAKQEEAFTLQKVVAQFPNTSEEAGQRLFKQCAACHTANDGGKNGIGPNLWNIVGRGKGAVDGFKYSSAMTDKGGDWTYDDIAHFIHDPKNWLKGTKMAFRGLKKEEDVAAMLMYLRSLSSDPKPLPTAEASAEAAPAEKSEAAPK
jgi:cytochrome c